MQTVTVSKKVVTDANVKFGFGQLFKPTPDIARNIFRVVLYAAAIANLFLDVVVEIPAPARLIIGKYSVYAVTLTHAISKMFGIDITSPPTNYNTYSPK